MMVWFLDRKDPKTELEGLERAQKLLDDRYARGQVTPEIYMKQSAEFGKRKEKYIQKRKKSSITTISGMRTMRSHQTRPIPSMAICPKRER
jgi:hypothetical protein